VPHYSAPTLHDLGGSPSLDPWPSRSAVDPVTKLAPGVGLIIALLLSLGLWGAIWLGASSLTAAWPW
jgi:hypothetical protein